MKAYPGKADVDFVFCDNCSTWRDRNKEISEGDYKRGDVSYSVHRSEADCELYYWDASYISDVTLYRCNECGEFLHNDGDVEDPYFESFTPWYCNNCSKPYESKSEANDCCT